MMSEEFFQRVRLRLSEQRRIRMYHHALDNFGVAGGDGFLRIF